MPLGFAPIQNVRLGHLAVEGDMGQAFRQRRCVGFGRPCVGVAERRQGCRLHHPLRRPAPAFLGDLGRRFEQDFVRRWLRRGRRTVGAFKSAPQENHEDPNNEHQRRCDGHTRESLREQASGFWQPSPLLWSWRGNGARVAVCGKLIHVFSLQGVLSHRKWGSHKSDHRANSKTGTPSNTSDPSD